MTEKIYPLYGVSQPPSCDCNAAPDSFTVTLSGVSEPCWCNELQDAIKRILSEHGVAQATVTIEVRDMTDKRLCHECGWFGVESQLLTAPNPFDAEDMLIGCPQCKSVNRLVVACDEPYCWREVSCGTPTDQGYRNTCSIHKPNRVSSKAPY